VTAATTQVIIDWITSLGWNTAQELGYPLLPGPEILDEPDRAVFITGGGGPGYTTEEPATDASVFQARLRGPSDDPFEPEVMAGQLDTLILRAPFPVVIDGVVVSHAHRMSNGPTPLPLDPSDRRHEFTCNYIFITGV
jgi:hypothetical protein